MTLTKRSWIRLAGWGSLAAMAALAGCSKKEETVVVTTPAGASAPATTVTTTTTMTATPGAPAAPAAAASGPLLIAFAYVGPVGDGGWTFAHDNGRKAVEKEFGAKVKTSYVEKVPEASHVERVFRDMASQGNKLIFGTTF